MSSHTRRRPWSRLLPALLTAAVFGLSAAPPAGAATSVSPLSPQPAADAIQPGLAVEYLYEKFYTLSDMYEASVNTPITSTPLSNSSSTPFTTSFSASGITTLPGI